MNGLPGPGNGTGLYNVSWKNNLTALVWTIHSPFLTLNTTVFYSLNTSSRAVANYGRGNWFGPHGDGPHVPRADAPWGESDGYAPSAISDTLVIYHNGHEANGHVPASGCHPNFDGVVDYLNELGYDVFEMMLPIMGCNAVDGIPREHAWFEQYEARGDFTLRYFIEPIALAVAHAKSKLGYKHIVLAGLSGGGWATTLAAAVLPQIDLSLPIAGSVPKWPTALFPDWVPDLPEGRNPAAKSPDVLHPPPVAGAGGDYEQNRLGVAALQHAGTRAAAYQSVGGYAELYVLGALEPGRSQLQILHEFDSCCFRGAGVFDGVKQYCTRVQQHLHKHAGGWMQTAVTAGNFHEVNPRDKVLIAHMVERLRRNGALQRSDFEMLPFDDLRVQ